MSGNGSRTLSESLCYILPKPLTHGRIPAKRRGMNPDAIPTLEKIIDFCHQKWAEADKHPVSDWPTPDMQTGKKMAFNEVLQFARKMLDEKG
jgi:hypothetical protein